MGFMIVLVALVMVFKSYVDYLNYVFLRRNESLRVVFRNGLLRLLVLITSFWVFVNEVWLSSLQQLILPLSIVFVGTVLIHLSTKRWNIKTLPIHVMQATITFFKEAFSMLIVVLVIYGVFESRLFSSLWEILLFSFTALILIYLMFYKLLLPKIFRFIPYKVREEPTKMFEVYPNLNETLYMAQSKKIRLPMNALFMAGVKRLKVVLSDALLARLTSSEIKGIVAHELGHGAKKHLWIRAVVMVLVIGVYLLMGYTVFQTNLVDRLFTEATLWHQLFVLILINYAVENIVLVALYQLTQFQEFQSDRYAQSLGYGEVLANALEKIHRYQPDPKEHPFSKRVGLSHPDTLLRVRLLRKSSVTINDL